MMILLAALCALVSPQDDLKTVASRFLTACDRPDFDDIDKEAGKLLKFDGKPAVNAFVQGYGMLRGKEPDLEKKARDLMEKCIKLEPKPPATTLPQDQYDELMAARADLGVAQRKLTACVKGRPRIVESLCEFTSVEAVKELIELFTNSKDGVLREAAVNAIRGMTGDAIKADVDKALLARLTKESEPVIKVAIIDTIVTRKIADAAAVKEFRACLKDPSWSIVFAAAGALAELDERDAAKEIIDTLKGRDGRLRASLGNILRKMTGYVYGGDYDGWIAWWDKFGADFVGGKYQKPDIKESGAQGGTGSSFFGIPIVSKNLCFVCDHSGSMAEPAVYKHKAAVSTGGGETLPPELAAGPKGERKIDVLKYELKMALWKLPEGTMFNLVFFNQGFTAWKSEPVQLNKTTRGEAFAYIESIQPEGATNIYDPTEKAFTWAEKGKKMKGIDTIMLMSDGFPNFGKYSTGPDVRKGIKDLNQNRKLQIDSIFLGTQKDKAGADLLKEISDDNFGRHVRYLD